MSPDSIEFASLLCSRLCHDLLSPVGAFNNGLELMAGETDPAMRERCVQLLEQSAETAVNRLKYFRLAFGSAGGFGDAVAASEILEAVRGIAGEKIHVEWLVADEALSKASAKLLLNMALIAIDALVRGGDLAIGYERIDNGSEIVVRASGARVVMDADIRRALEGQIDDQAILPRTAAAWMTRMLATRNEGGIAIAMDEPGVLVFGASMSGTT